MFETFKKRVRALEAKPENRLSALKVGLPADAPVVRWSAEFKRLHAAGLLAGRIIIAPDEPLPKEPIL
jgi:hypothetical protein